MPEQFPVSTLAGLVVEHVDAARADLRFERIPTGHFNTSYFVDGAARPMVLRIAPPDDAGFVFYERRMMAQEPGIHSLVRARTSAPVAEIMAFDDSRKLLDRDYLIMERLPGVPLTQFAHTPRQFDRVLRQIGCHLRAIHDITAGLYGYLGEHRCMEPQDNWGSAFRLMWRMLAEDVARAGYYDPDELSHALGLLERHFHHFERPVTSRLLHMDIWSQNILVESDASVTGIVDFDRALWGDREIEFAVLDYCGISEPAFWQGYGAKRDTSQSARVRQAFYLLYEVQKYIVICHHRKGDPDAAARYKRQVMGMLSRL